MADNIRSQVSGVGLAAEVVYDAATGPGTGNVAVTPSDTVPITPTPRAIWVGTAGNVALRGPADIAAVTYKNVANGTLIPVRAAYVYATGTTATDIVAIF